MQSLNRYAYALNNPTTLIDPLGLAPGDPCTIESASLVNCPPTTITVSGGTIYNSAEWNYLNNFGFDFANSLGSNSSNGHGGGISAPNPAPARPMPDVPLDPFAKAVFDQVGCELQPLAVLPQISGGGVFGFYGFEPEIPLVPAKGEALGIANYDTSGGLSTGFVFGVTGTESSPLRFPGVGIEEAYNWQSGTVTSEGLGFFGSETEGLNVGAVGGGLFFGSEGAVGVYGQIGPFGGGGYLNLSYPGCGGGS